MEIEEFLSRGDVAVDLRSNSKAHLLQELAKRAGARLGVDPVTIASELQKREALGSTGVGAGIAIPHARLNAVRTPFGLIVRLKRAIDFDAIDREPVDLVFLLLQAAESSSDLNALASIARKLRDPDRVRTMRCASDAAALYQELTR